MADSLAELREQGKGSSAPGMALSRGMQDSLKELSTLIGHVVAEDEQMGQRPAHTIAGKYASAQAWLANLSRDDHGLGARSAILISAEGRKVAHSLNDPMKSDMMRLCDDVEALALQIQEYCGQGRSQSSECRAAARALSEKVLRLKEAIEDCLVDQMTTSFLDIGSPLKQFAAACHAPLNSPNRDGIFEDRARKFQDHGEQLTNTARLVALDGGSSNKRLIETILHDANRLDSLSGQVLSGGNILFANPNSEEAADHFDLLRNQWLTQMEGMRANVGDAVDLATFVRTTDQAIRQATGVTEAAIAKGDPQAIVEGTSLIARHANRVLLVSRRECENSEDQAFVEKLDQACALLSAAIPNMVQKAKAVTINPRDGNSVDNWGAANEDILRAVSNIHELVEPKSRRRDSALPSPKPPPPLSNNITNNNKELPNMTSLNISTDDDRFPYRSSPLSGGRPSSRSETTDDEDETFPEQDEVDASTQPIMQAAYSLHMDVRQWSSRDNEIIAAAKRMALLMARLAELVRDETGSKRELIIVAKQIAVQSEEVTEIARQLAAECTDKRIKMILLQVCERIPTIGTQLNILSTVKAAMLGVQGTEEDNEATELLVGNAQNLMQSVRETVRVAEAASIKIRIDSGYRIRWARKKPWYFSQQSLRK